MNLYCPKCNSDNVKCWLVRRNRCNAYYDETSKTVMGEMYGSSLDEDYYETDDQGNTLLKCGDCEHEWKFTEPEPRFATFWFTQDLFTESHAKVLEGKYVKVTDTKTNAHEGVLKSAGISTVVGSSVIVNTQIVKVMVRE